MLTHTALSAVCSRRKDMSPELRSSLIYSLFPVKKTQGLTRFTLLQCFSLGFNHQDTTEAYT
jgi:hypothetical protein